LHSDNNRGRFFEGMRPGHHLNEMSFIETRSAGSARALIDSASLTAGRQKAKGRSAGALRP